MDVTPTQECHSLTVRWCSTNPYENLVYVYPIRLIFMVIIHGSWGLRRTGPLLSTLSPLHAIIADKSHTEVYVILLIVVGGS
jgi:hypothetical protein